MKFTKKDFFFSVVTGLLTGVIAWRVLLFLNKVGFHGVSFSWLIIIIPVVWIIGVNLGYFLGRFFKFFNQFGKFAAIGFTNFAVDLGILDLLIAYSGHNAGYWYSIFKGTSFISATLLSYVWNKYWTFEAGKSGGGGGEFAKFFGVAILAFLVNVGVASLVVNTFGPHFGISADGWAQVGAVCGSAVALIFSFVGFRLAVFRKSATY